MNQFIKTTAFNKISKLTKRIRFVNGGSSSSKTISIIIWLIDYCQTHKNKIVSVVSETRPHLAKGASRDFINIMQSHNYFKDDFWNKTDLVYSFETGTKLEFFSADQPGKVRGPRRDVLFLNEGNNISYEIFTQLEIRTNNIVWIDSNPTHEYWAYTELLGKKDIDFVTLTYHDNEALSKNIIETIESRKDNKQWYNVYGLGQLGQLEERIYSGWQIIKDIPFEAKLVRYGMDFGYTNDPTVIIAIYRYNNAFIIDEITYLKGLSNKTIADIFLNKPKALIIADSSEPKSIEEIYSYGVNIIGANKGPGSVYQGIQYVQNQKISITERSIKTIKAYRNYLFIKDKDERILNEPDDTIHEWSNSMDALRYGMESLKPQEEDIIHLPDETKWVSRI